MEAIVAGIADEAEDDPAALQPPAEGLRWHHPARLDLRERMRQRLRIEGHVVVEHMERPTAAAHPRPLLFTPSASSAFSSATPRGSAPASATLASPLNPQLQEPDQGIAPAVAPAEASPAGPPKPGLAPRAAAARPLHSKHYPWQRVPSEQRPEALEARRLELLATPDHLQSPQGQEEWACLMQARDALVRNSTLDSPRQAPLRKLSAQAGSPAATCVECAVRGRTTVFSPFRFRQTCANCGAAVCSSCSASRVLLPNASEKQVRVCDSCNARLTGAKASVCVRSVHEDGDEGVHWLVELPHCLWSLRSIVELHIEHAGVASLPEAIGEMRSLKVLNLARNRLAALPATLGSLALLEVLMLSHNLLRSLPPSLAQLRQLRELYLAENQLMQLEPWIKLLAGLRLIDLTKNVHLALPSLAYIKNMISLQQLTVSGIALEGVLPSALWECSELTRIEANACHLTALSVRVGNLGMLTSLELPNNDLAQLPSSLGLLENLETLIVTGNPLRALPDALCRLAQLKTLEAADCQLAALPVGMGQLRCLVHLDVRNNLLTALPPSTRRLNRLETCQLSGNPMTSAQDTMNKKSTSRHAPASQGLAALRQNGLLAGLQPGVHVPVRFGKGRAMVMERGGPPWS
jgi:Leucine-rich repeat (LRR) protein